MMKKLAVTVFALSLTALGCGSDDGGKKDAARPDGPPGAEVQVQTDVPLPLDAPVGPEVQRDQPIAIDQAQAVEVQAAVEVRPVEAGIDTARIEAQRPVDGGTPDAPVGLDGGKLDAPPAEVAKPIDGGVDGGSAG